jgi:hypothetical protein
MSFDAPSREFCVVRRPRTNTPLQALTILNDPVYVEAAQALASKIAAQGRSTAEDRVTYGFRACVARAPQPHERERLVQLYHQQVARFQADPAAAAKIVTPLGAFASAPGEGLAETAAWTVVANVLLNLDEMVTKG